MQRAIVDRFNSRFYRPERLDEVEEQPATVPQTASPWFSELSGTTIRWIEDLSDLSTGDDFGIEEKKIRSTNSNHAEESKPKKQRLNRKPIVEQRPESSLRRNRPETDGRIQKPSNLISKKQSSNSFVVPSTEVHSPNDSSVDRKVNNSRVRFTETSNDSRRAPKIPRVATLEPNNSRQQHL
jgi:hypothetical protein